MATVDRKLKHILQDPLPESLLLILLSAELVKDEVVKVPEAEDETTFCFLLGITAV